jgi:hypothetical protein
MNDVQQLGEMLRHYAESEAHKKQLFETQSQAGPAASSNCSARSSNGWNRQAPNLLEVSREAYVAFGPSARWRPDLQDRKLSI